MAKKAAPRKKGPLERKIKKEPVTRKESLDYEAKNSPPRGKGPLERKAAPPRKKGPLERKPAPAKPAVKKAVAKKAAKRAASPGEIVRAKAAKKAGPQRTLPPKKKR